MERVELEQLRQGERSRWHDELTCGSERTKEGEEGGKQGGSGRGRGRGRERGGREKREGGSVCLGVCVCVCVNETESDGNERIPWSASNA
eukprot:2943369-Pleurochrysis_carterae.AAC.1